MTELTDLANKQKTALAKSDEKYLQDITDAYTIMYDRLQGDINALTLAMEDLEDPTSVEVKALPEYKRLVQRMNTELDRFTIYLETVLAAAALSAIGAGLSDSAALLGAAGVTGFTSLEANAMKPLLNYLAEDGPLYARLQELTGATVDSVVKSIIDGVSSGLNPRVIADNIQDAFGGGLTDALRNTRTLQLYSYRDSARANYMASGVVNKWIWWAELDGDVCMSCVAEHGTLHDLDEQMDSHYNCRCAPLPYIEGITEETQSGENWFNGLSQEQQSDMMGSEYYSAYKDGAFTLSDMIKPTENEIYGTMNVVTPLWELLGAESPIRK